MPHQNRVEATYQQQQQQQQWRLTRHHNMLQCCRLLLPVLRVCSTDIVGFRIESKTLNREGSDKLQTTFFVAPLLTKQTAYGRN
jgi:hypothetical protein